MSAQSPYGISSWAFWPVGDRYSLTPKWEESHTDYDSTVRPQDEPNRLELVGDHGVAATDIYFTLMLRDMTDPKDPIVPTEEPTIIAWMEKAEGWVSEFTMPYELVQEGDPLAWNGDVKFDFTQPMKDWVGYEQPVRLTIDAEFPSDAPERIRVGYGSLVLRR